MANPKCTTMEIHHLLPSRYIYPIPLRGYPPPCPFRCGVISKLGSRSKPKSLKNLFQVRAKIVENLAWTPQGEGAPSSKKSSKSWFAGTLPGDRFSTFSTLDLFSAALGRIRAVLLRSVFKPWFCMRFGRIFKQQLCHSGVRESWLGLHRRERIAY